MLLLREIISTIQGKDNPGEWGIILYAAFVLYTAVFFILYGLTKKVCNAFMGGKQERRTA